MPRLTEISTLFAMIKIVLSLIFFILIQMQQNVNMLDLLLTILSIEKSQHKI